MLRGTDARGQSIVEDDRQVTCFGKLHPQLAMGGWAAERPSTAVQVDDHRMSTGTLGHRDVGTKARAQLDVLFETANCRKVLVVNGRQLLPSAALRNNVAGGIPGRQSTQNLTVVFADHGTYLPAFRKARAHPAKATRAVFATRGVTTTATDEIGLFTAKYRISFADKRQS